MKYVKICLRCFTMLFVVFFSLSLLSCSSEKPADKNEVVEYLRSKIYETAPVSDDTVFWVKGGSVYHLYRDCRFLEKAEDIRYGTAAQSGRSKVCEVCSKRYELENTTVETQSAAELRETPPDTASVDGTEAAETVGALEALDTLTASNGDPADRSAPAQTEAPNDYYTDNTSTTVYWTPSGSVWHSDPKCTTLARSKTILSGTIAESGKPRGCKVCTNSD